MRDLFQSRYLTWPFWCWIAWIFWTQPWGAVDLASRDSLQNYSGFCTEQPLRRGCCNAFRDGAVATARRRRCGTMSGLIGALCPVVDLLSVFPCRFDDCQTRYVFLITRRGVTQVNALSDRFWEQTFWKTVMYIYSYTPFLLQSWFSGKWQCFLWFPFQVLFHWTMIMGERVIQYQDDGGQNV